MSSKTNMDIEGNINKVIYRVFPHWYLQNALKEISLNAVGQLNAASFNAKHWINLEEISYAASKSLSDKPEWFDVANAFNELIDIGTEKRCFLNIFDLHGVWNVHHNERYDSLDDYALSPHCSHIDMFADESFEFNKSQAFVDEVAMPAYFREWDGRIYLINTMSAEYIATLKLQNKDLKKHLKLELNLRTKSINPTSIKLLTKQYGVYLMDKYAAAVLSNLFSLSGHHITYADFMYNQDKYALTILDRSDEEMMLLLKPFLKRHLNKSIIDFGAYLNKHHHACATKLTVITQQDLDNRAKVKHDIALKEQARLDAIKAKEAKKTSKKSTQSELDLLKSKIVNPIDTLAKLIKEDFAAEAKERAFLDKEKYGEKALQNNKNSKGKTSKADNDFTDMKTKGDKKTTATQQESTTTQQASSTSAEPDKQTVEETYHDLFMPKIEQIIKEPVNVK